MHEFLVGNNGVRQVPINLGDISYACVGNIHHCPDGFTMAFWLKVDKGYPNIAAQVRFEFLNGQLSCCYVFILLHISSWAIELPYIYLQRNCPNMAHASATDRTIVLGA